MIPAPPDNSHFAGRPANEAGKLRIGILLFVLCSIAAVSGVVWFLGAPKHHIADSGDQAGGQPTPALSENTRNLLKQLDAPVQIRFYALLDPASVPDSLQAFAAEVDQLLSDYQRQARAKIRVTRYTSRSGIKAAAAAAAADNLKPFNLDKGDACYFGVAIAQEDRLELLAQLGPESQQPLELDLTGAIDRVTRSKGPAPRLANTPAPTPAATEEVKRTIPDFASVSMGEGTRLLRAAALKDFKDTAAAMEIQVAEARESLAQARNGGSEAQQQAALNHLQQVQSEHTEKLQQIAARSAAQIEALRLLKETAH